MRFILGIILGITLSVACSMGIKWHEFPKKDDVNSIFFPKKDTVGIYFKTECEQWGLKNECRKTKEIVKDMCNEAQFNDFQSKNMVLINYQTLLKYLAPSKS